MVVDVVLETVSKKVLSFHSDSLCKPLEVPCEVNDINDIFNFTDGVVEDLLFPFFEAG